MGIRAISIVGLPLLLLAAPGGCARPPAPSDQEPPPPAADEIPDLLASLQATILGDSVRFVLQVTNTTREPLDLDFRSGQSFDFVVRRGEQEVWRWSAEQMFTQALRRETVPPGETLTYDATWAPPPGTRGEFTVVGRLTASDHPVQQQVRFRLP